MIVRIVKPRYALEPGSEPEKAPAWRNLVFLKCGKTFYGCDIHPSEQAACAVMKNWEQLARRTYFQRPIGDFRIVDEDGNHLYMYSEYSHAMQIPWSDR